MKNKNRYFLSEFIGSCFLVMIIVGSGLMAENLTNDTAIMLIANTLATGAGLFVLITVFADVSGAHFNPVVSIAFALHGKLEKRKLLNFVAAQCLGATAGALLVFLINDEVAGMTLPKESLSTGLVFLIEIGITFILMFTILRAPCLVGTSIPRIAVLVGATVGFNAYFFGPMTGASMNPARTLGPAWVAGNGEYLWLYFLGPVMGGLLALAIHKSVPTKVEGCC